MNRPLMLICAGALVLSSCGSSSSDSSDAAPAEANQAATAQDAASQNAETQGETSDQTDSQADGQSGSEAAVEAENDAVPDELKSVVIERFATLGGWDGNDWVSFGSPNSFTGPAASGDSFSIINLDGVGETVAATELGLVCDALGSVGWLTEPEVPSNWVGENPIAVKAEWNLVPYGPAAESAAAPLYFDLAREFFAAISLDVGDLEIDQWFKLDLEGDGVDEVVFTVRTSGVEPAAGPYEYPIVSAVFLNRVIDEEGHLFLLDHQLITKADGATFDIYDPYFLTYRVEAFADLNGDGKQEVVISGKGYESVGTAVWEYVSDAAGPKMVLSAGCGA